MSRAARRDPRAGFSMLETVIAVFVLSLGAALVVGAAGRSVEQVEVHAAFQDFRTAVARLRQEAFAAETPQAVTPERSGLAPGWSLRGAAPVVIAASGDCAPAELELLKGERVRARLVSDGRGCRFLRAD